MTSRPLLPGVTPSAADDFGVADPALAAALRAGDVATVATLLPAARLIVPVVAMPGSGEAEMAVPALVNEAGLRALPVFSSVDALASWRREARPVPMAGVRVVVAAVTESYDGLVIDVAGPATCTLDREALDRMAGFLTAARQAPGC